LQNLPRHRHTTARQVKSSPARGHGSEDVPIELDLTPKPVRRQLFPSPDKVQVRSDPGAQAAVTKASESLPSFVRRSPRLNKTRDVFAVPNVPVAISVGGKENLPPMTGVEDELDDLFDEAATEVDLPLPPVTPKRRSERILLKTPSKTPGREFGTEMSHNASQLPIFRTPRQKQAQHPALAALIGSVQKNVMEMTPFTRSIHEAMTSDLPEINLDEAPFPATGLQPSPPKLSFDFPDLPSLKNSSPISGNDQLVNFGLSEMTTDRLDSDMMDPFVNGTMPSSPPVDGFYGYFDHNAGDDGLNAMWDEMVQGDGLDEETSKYPDPEGLMVAERGDHMLRRSPRRQKVK
jgi:hypothetical protein